MEPLQLIATATAGLEACVKHELSDLGFPDAKVCSPGRILFSGDAATLARANLWLRTAERVLLLMGTFEARDFGELFDRTHALPWEQWIPADGAFPVSGRSHKSQLSSVPACQKIVKKAIVEKLRAAHRVSTLPESGPVVPVEVAILEDSVRLTIDTSGPGLHKRGYRAAAGPAPLKETIAAAMIQLSFWRPDRPLIDPFCGSGTIPIEAALIGRNIAPGLNRRFQAEDWPALAPGIWADERARARDLIRPALPMKIIGSDIEEKAASLSAYHAGLAGVADDVEFQIRPFAELRSNDRYGFVLCNPPYGERFNEGLDIQGIYRSMSEVFRRLPTWSFYILTSENLEAVLGQQASRRRKLYNGPIECTFFQFHGPRPGKGEVESPAAPIVQEGDVKLPPAWQEEADDDLPPAVAPVFGGLKANAAAQAEAFANRLKKTARHLRRWPARGVTCYRLYDRDIPEVPLAVDIYEGRLHLAEYQRPHDRTPAEHANWLDLMAETAGEVLGVTRELTFLKRRERQKGAAQYGKFSQTGYVATVHEG
ncbi:MAG: THUMP domain-containing protein, partial [Planctomycetota bacterium]